MSKKIYTGGYESRHFTEDEFKCPCCGLLLVDVNLLKRLDNVRDDYGYPIVPSSGCRCKKYNEKIGGADNSYHLCTERDGHDLLCRAVDIPFSGNPIKDKKLMDELHRKFARVIVYKKHVHVDMGTEKYYEVKL